MLAGQSSQIPGFLFLFSSPKFNYIAELKLSVVKVLGRDVVASQADAWRWVASLDVLGALNREALAPLIVVTSQELLLETLG